MAPNLSIVVPAFDEQNRIGASIDKILSYTRENDMNAELIVVDDGSKDDTKAAAEVAMSAHPEIPSRRN